MTLNPRQSAALALHRRGFVVMLAHRADHLPDGGKVPLAKDWQNAPDLTEQQILAQWAGPNPCNISVLTGHRSGIFVLDIDPTAGGFETMGAIVAAHGKLPATYVVRTGSGGFHYYFQMPDFDLRNSAGKLGPGIDTRANGGQVIAATSTSSKGPYTELNPGAAILPAPDWMVEALRPKQVTPVAADAPVDMSKAEPYEQRAVAENIARLHALSAAATANPADYRGEPWDATVYAVACRLTEFALASWSSITHDTVEAILLEHAPRDGGFDEARIRAKADGARRSVTKAATPPRGSTRVDDSDMFNDPALHSKGSVGPTVSGDAQLDVSNPAQAALWLRHSVGTDRLAGLFSRKGELVFTPRVGHEGYIEARDMRAENSASISLCSAKALQARVQNRFQVIKGTGTPAVFPIVAAELVVNALDDAPGLRELRGVVHTPTFRRDGTLITRPGYDEATSLLFLPVDKQPDVVPETPTLDDVKMAVKRLEYMLQDFAFVTEHDKASYLGLMLTPLLRNFVPAPYKLGVIEAHQPGSGKTFLARALTSIHGGAMQSELPGDDEELGKTISAVLDTQTAPVVVFDNVTGLVRSSRLAGLLTNPVYTARRLGTGQVIEAENDRLWVITANNAALGGDLGRRNVRVRIDPGVPNPEERTEFAIADFEGWVREHRHELLWSLLTLIRHWVVQGMPFTGAPAQDSYGRWTATLRGILRSAGLPGTFDDASTRAVASDPENEDWSVFAAAVWEATQGRGWTTKELLSLVGHELAEGMENKPLSMDNLPSTVVGDRPMVAPSTLSRTLGKHLAFRRGRWFGGFSFQDTGQMKQRRVVWRLQKYGD